MHKTFTSYHTKKKRYGKSRMYFEIGYSELGGMVVETRRCLNVLRADFSITFI